MDNIYRRMELLVDGKSSLDTDGLNMKYIPKLNTKNSASNVSNIKLKSELNKNVND